MPGGNGTGPKGEGPLTGRGMGYCILKADSDDPSHIEGFAGIEGRPVSLSMENRRGVTIISSGDRTGPAGMGPMTGRAVGYDSGYPVPGYINLIPARGLDFGRGGRGRRKYFYAAGPTGWRRAAYEYLVWGGYSWSLSYMNAYASYGSPLGLTKEQEMDMLRDQAKYLEDALFGINNRIRELETEKKS